MIERYKEGDLNVKPTQRILCTVLNGCAHTGPGGESEALRVAVAVQNLLFNELELFERPGRQIFKNSMMAFRHLIKDKTIQDRFTNAIFRRYCEEGLVDETILELLKRHSPSLYRKLPGVNGSESDLEALPKEWSSVINK